MDNKILQKMISLLFASAATATPLSVPSANAQAVSPTTIAARQHYFGLDNVSAETGAVRSDRVILSWMGISNFAAALNGHVVLMNAWIPRGWIDPPRWPGMAYSGTTPEELAALDPEVIFFGHGHGDHAGDIPFVVRSHPGITVAGAAEHCSDLRAEVPDVEFNCISALAEEAEFGVTNQLDNLIPGVEITVIKQPHSSNSNVTETNPAFNWLIQNAGGTCLPFSEYADYAEEPPTWTAPNAGAITAMWQFRIGEFALVWQDTAGPIAGTGVPTALTALPQTDVRLASIVVAGRETINEHLEILKPKVFIPVHHDPCGWTMRQGVIEELSKLPSDIRPQLWFMSDPGDYLRPLSFDPTAEIWADEEN